MSSISLQSIPIICQVHNLSIVTGHSDDDATDRILPYDEPFSVQVSLGFVGTNAIALLALEPTIQVDFHAKPLQAGPTIDLGCVTEAVVLQQMDYTLMVDLDSPDECGLTTAIPHNIGALIRVGGLGQPALLCGVLEDLVVQIYRP